MNNEPTLLELIHEYGRQMETTGLDSAVRPDQEEQDRRRGERLLDEIERRLRNR